MIDQYDIAYIPPTLYKGNTVLPSSLFGNILPTPFAKKGRKTNARCRTKKEVFMLKKKMVLHSHKHTQEVNSLFQKVPFSFRQLEKKKKEDETFIDIFSFLI